MLSVYLSPKELVTLGKCCLIGKLKNIGNHNKFVFGRPSLHSKENL
jgi:hypothetical protein